MGSLAAAGTGSSPRLADVFNFSGSEIIFLLLLALIILGPEKLPDAIRSFGKTYAEFKKMTTGFQSELKNALDEPMREMRETADAFKQAASFDIAADMLEGKRPSNSGAEPPVAPAPEPAPAATTSPPTPAAPAVAPIAPEPAEGRRDQELPSFDSIVMGRDHNYRPASPDAGESAASTDEAPDVTSDAGQGDDQAEAR